MGVCVVCVDVQKHVVVCAEEVRDFAYRLKEQGRCDCRYVSSVAAL